MPPYFGICHLYSRIQNEVIPVLELLAENDALRERSLRRFERNEPPAYASSTDEEEEVDDYVPLPRRPDGRLPEQVEASLAPPLTRREKGFLASAMRGATAPARCYRREVEFERIRLEGCEPFALNMLFRNKHSPRREDVLIRHLIKRRWEKLGIWNPRWGVPHLAKPLDNETNLWKWRWEEQDAPGPHLDESSEEWLFKGQTLCLRALHLRQDLRRGEAGPVIPRSCLPPDATASEAESFLISRPWFIYQLERGEEHERFSRRVDRRQERALNHSNAEQVNTWWKERGDWRDKFDVRSGRDAGGTFVWAWKWRHESPSPEPEDITPIGRMEDSLLDVQDEMEFTPSEIDVLESIPSMDYHTPPRPVSPGAEYRYDFIFNPFPTHGPFERAFYDDGPQDANGPDEEPVEPQRDASLFPPRGSDEEGDRIAGVKRPVEELPSEPQAAPSKRQKGEATPEAAAATVHPSAANEEGAAAQVKRGRGRPRKERTAGETVARVERGRGHPRKDGRTCAPIEASAETPAKGLAEEMAGVQDKRGRGRPREDGHNTTPTRELAEMPAPAETKKDETDKQENAPAAH